MAGFTPTCIYCDRTSDQIPLITFQFRDKEQWICPQHLPILIHQPDKLVDKLPGVIASGDTELSAPE